MTLSEIDPNMAATAEVPEHTVWFSAKDTAHISTFGVYFDDEAGQYLRMPTAVAAATSPGVERLHRHTAGGRLCFVTDSTHITLYAKVRVDSVMSNMAWSGQACFDLYIDNVFHGLFRSTAAGGFVSSTFSNPLPSRRALPKGCHHIVINFPSYAEVYDVAVGVDEGAEMRCDDPYDDRLPILYYGSSITQGASSTRPGLIYQNHIARALATDYINLGFSGCAKGEAAMIEYLTTIPSSVFVCDYDHNHNNADKLRATHYPLYRAYRAAHPDTPIVFLTRPDIDLEIFGDATHDVVVETFERARSEGDTNVYFIDGEILFGETDRDACTVDGTHPNDIGFYRFYKVLCPLLRRLLNQ